MNQVIYTIGHSDLTLDVFIEHLQRHGITTLADVRSSPYSRLHPQFNRGTLKRAVQEGGIGYVYLGKELGARAEQPECYLNGKVQFTLLARQPIFLEGVNRVLKGLEKHRIALMCSEKDPLQCHRTILVARQFHARGIAVRHILYDGSIEAHEAVEKRMLKTLKMEPVDLFRNEQEIIGDAYRQWGDRIAYVAESADGEGWGEK